MNPAARRAFVLALLGAGLAGCGKYYWTKPGSTIETFERDSAACALETSANPTAASVGAVEMKAYRTCLTARGYLRQQHPFQPPDGYRGFE